jgi:hypothetical protein
MSLESGAYGCYGTSRVKISDNAVRLPGWTLVQRGILRNRCAPEFGAGGILKRMVDTTAPTQIFRESSEAGSRARDDRVRAHRE